MTSRIFYTRLAEHKGRSFRTGNLLAHPPHSAVRIQAEQCNVPVFDGDFRISASTTGVSEMRILESVYIFKQKPSLNAANSSYPLEIVNR
jgi:hypothetical protein